MTDLAEFARAYDAENLRAFLKQNATVVAPGETLVIRAPDLTPMQMREVHDVLNAVDPDGTPWLPFRTVVVPGDGFGVVKPGELREALRDLVRAEFQAEVRRQRQIAMRNPTLPRPRRT